MSNLHRNNSWMLAMSQVTQDGPQEAAAQALRHVLMSAQAAYYADIILAPAGPRPVSLPRKLPYSAALALGYAREYCAGGNACRDSTFDSDCSHFVAHILKAGGIRFDGPRHQCASGCATAVSELMAAFINASEIYENVRVFKDPRLAEAGDLVFRLENLNAAQDHVMMLDSQVDVANNKAFVFGHTHNRCGRAGVAATVFPDQCCFYRLSDA